MKGNTSRSDAKALAAIIFLREHRKTRSLITYGTLGGRIDHPPRLLGNVLDRVGAWCRRNGKESLALLVVDRTTSKPGKGMFKRFKSDPNPVTPENYEERRDQLWQENWSDIPAPDIIEIADAYRSMKL